MPLPRGRLVASLAQPPAEGALQFLEIVALGPQWLLIPKAA
ncbi:MAG TPA: hypothetical protein VFU88_16900 [Ktedonobacterales bacterium]|nr:hypothetical protein [Ktedonobacterales bacterium]